MTNRLLDNCIVSDCENKVWARNMCHKHYSRWRSNGDPNVVRFRQSHAGAPQQFIDSIPDCGSGCITWPFAKNNAGYGQINIRGTKGRKLLVSRIVCERRWGSPPSLKHQAAHSCGNGHGGCVSPWHLTWKLPIENSADMITHGTRLRGEMSPRAKLTSQDVATIRAISGTAPQHAIASRFGISQTMVSRIILRKAWRDLEVIADMIGVDVSKLERAA